MSIDVSHEQKEWYRKGAFFERTKQILQTNPSYILSSAREISEQKDPDESQARLRRIVLNDEIEQKFAEVIRAGRNYVNGLETHLAVASSPEAHSNIDLSLSSFMGLKALFSSPESKSLTTKFQCYFENRPNDKQFLVSQGIIGPNDYT